MSAGAGGSCREASTPPALKGPCRQNRTEASCPSLWSLSTGQLGSGHDQEADGHMRVRRQDQQDRRPHVAGGEAMAAEKGGVPPGGRAGPRGPAGRMQGSRRWVGRGLAVGSSPQPAALVSVEVLGDPSELVVFSVPCGSRTRRSSGVTAGRSSSCAGRGRCGCRGGSSLGRPSARLSGPVPGPSRRGRGVRVPAPGWGSRAFPSEGQVGFPVDGVALTCVLGETERKSRPA